MSKNMSHKAGILSASKEIDGNERASIPSYFQIGEHYFDGVTDKEWKSQRECAEVVGIALSRIQRGAKVREFFATVAEAQKAFDNAHGFTLMGWIESLGGGKGKGGEKEVSLSKAEKAAAHRLFSHPDFLALPTAVQKKMKKAAGL